VHSHHIVPIYRCKELGLTTSYKVNGVEFYFKENIAKVTRLQHANIHWGYYCKDLSALLEVCSPPQWVIDMIPLGDKRDISSAQFLAMGEIGNIDISGENNPNYKHGKAIKGSEYHNDYMNEMQKNYREKNRDAINERYRKWCAKNRDVLNERYRKWCAKNKDAIRKYQKNYQTKNRDVLNERQRNYYAKNRDAILERQRKRKQERQGVGNLENFIS
jgi:hypothetical protein